MFWHSVMLAALVGLVPDGSVPSPWALPSFQSMRRKHHGPSYCMTRRGARFSAGANKSPKKVSGTAGRPSVGSESLLGLGGLPGSRDDIVRGAIDLGVELDEHIHFVIDAMAGELGLGASPRTKRNRLEKPSGSAAADYSRLGRWQR